MRSWFEHNLNVLNETQPQEAAILANFQPIASKAGFSFSSRGGDDKSAEISLECGPKGGPCLMVKTDSGISIRLSSAYSPQDEDRAVAERFFSQNSPPQDGLTVLGFGLGFLAEISAQKIDDELPLWVFEARPELAAAALTARELTTILKRPNFRLYLGPIGELPQKAPKTVLPRPANLRVDCDLYPQQQRPTINAHSQGDRRQCAYSQDGHNQKGPDQKIHSQNIHDKNIHDHMANGQNIHEQNIHGHMANDQKGLDQKIHSQNIHEQNIHDHMAHDQNIHGQNIHDHMTHDQNIHEQNTHGQKAYTLPLLSRQARVLMLDTGYFISKELQRAAKLLGLQFAVHNVKVGETSTQTDFLRLLELIKQFKPTLLLTVNHLGFDAEGILAQTMEKLGLAVASWFVDSPCVILGEAKNVVAQGLHIFSWDSDYLQPLRQMGFESVHHLPLATDGENFRIYPSDGKERHNVSFVGDSLTAATAKYLALSGIDADQLGVVDRLAQEFLADDQLTPMPLLTKLAAKLNLSEEQKLNLAALITWRASRLWRLKVLSAIPVKHLSIAGDDAWKKLLPKAKIFGKVDYFQALPKFYRASEVNLNITSAQMKGGLNQRVFDVPATGSFLLTDHRKQLEEFFELESEVITYHSPQQACEKAQWWLFHPLQRRKIIEKARNRILKEHLYRHRLDKLIKTVKKS
ncbi:MAG: glycosyltransferase [Deltaproteobacteria bacterium]|jgi:spore maturation protein CgeB|nr:glycosyltransferase [Deltaproteobacteria bacterium]